MIEATPKKSPNPLLSWGSVERVFGPTLLDESYKTALQGKLTEDPLHRFPSTTTFDGLRNYANQVGTELDRALFDEAQLREAAPYFIARSGITRYSYHIPRKKLGVWGDAFIRFRYQAGLCRTSTDFALLAYLTDDPDAAFRSFDELINFSDACDFESSVDAWLNSHGFRPTLLPEDVGIPHAPMIEALLRTASFAEAIGRASYLARGSTTLIAAKAGVDREWFRGLIEGQYVYVDETAGEHFAFDVEALTRVATYFGVDADLFVSRAIPAILVSHPRKVKALAVQVGVDRVWLKRLFKGRKVAFDLAAIKRVARFYGGDPNLLVNHYTAVLGGRSNEGNDQ